MFLGRLWIDVHDAIAKQRGWSLFDADGVLTIQKIDDMEEVLHGIVPAGFKEFTDDDEACNHVVEMAACGDKTSLLALFLDGKESHYGAEGEDTWIPDALG